MSGFRLWGVGFGVWSSGCSVLGPVFWVQGSGFGDGVLGSGWRVGPEKLGVLLVPPKDLFLWFKGEGLSVKRRGLRVEG